MSGFRNNNRRKRSRSRWQKTTSMFSNIINTISTCLVDRINGIRSFYTTYPQKHNSLCDSDQTSESDDCISPPPKRRCNNRISQSALESQHSNNGARVVELIETDSESDSSREISLRQGYWHQADCTNRAININAKPSSKDAYPSISTTNHLQDCRRVAWLKPARLRFDKTINMDSPLKNSGNIQHALSEAYVRNTQLENITLRRVVKAQDPGPSRSPMNHYKTRTLVTPRQVPYCVSRYRSRSRTIPNVTSRSESKVRSWPRRAVENAPPMEIGSSSIAKEPMCEEMYMEVSNQAVPSDTMFMQPDTIDYCPEIYPSKVSSKINSQTITAATKTLGNPPSTQNESDQFNESIMANCDKWECTTCIGLNEWTTDVCLCCGSLAPNAKIVCRHSATTVHGDSTTTKYGYYSY